LPHPKFWAGYISAAANVYATVSIFGVKTNAPFEMVSNWFYSEKCKIIPKRFYMFFPPKPQGTAVQGAGISLASSILFSA